MCLPLIKLCRVAGPPWNDVHLKSFFQCSDKNKTCSKTYENFTNVIKNHMGLLLAAVGCEKLNEKKM